MLEFSEHESPRQSRASIDFWMSQSSERGWSMPVRDHPGFRYPAFVNGHDDLLIEAPAGLLDERDPAKAIRDEVQEETGFHVGDVQRIFDAFMSPGSVTERLHFFVAPYRSDDRRSDGGGAVEEGEDIEVLEPTIETALAWIAEGRVRDGKTIMLLQYAALNIFDNRK